MLQQTYIVKNYIYIYIYFNQRSVNVACCSLQIMYFKLSKHFLIKKFIKIFFSLRSDITLSAGKAKFK